MKRTAHPQPGDSPTGTGACLDQQQLQTLAKRQRTASSAPASAATSRCNSPMMVVGDAQQQQVEEPKLPIALLSQIMIFVNGAQVLRHACRPLFSQQQQHHHQLASQHTLSSSASSTLSSSSIAAPSPTQALVRYLIKTMFFKWPNQQQQQLQEFTPAITTSNSTSAENDAAEPSSSSSTWYEALFPSLWFNSSNDTDLHLTTLLYKSPIVAMKTPILKFVRSHAMRTQINGDYLQMITRACATTGALINGHARKIKLRIPNLNQDHVNLLKALDDERVEVSIKIINQEHLVELLTGNESWLPKRHNFTLRFNLPRNVNFGQLEAACSHYDNVFFKLRSNLADDDESTMPKTMWRRFSYCTLSSYKAAICNELTQPINGKKHLKTINLKVLTFVGDGDGDEETAIATYADFLIHSFVTPIAMHQLNFKHLKIEHGTRVFKEVLKNFALFNDTVERLTISNSQDIEFDNYYNSGQLGSSSSTSFNYLARLFSAPRLRRVTFKNCAISDIMQMIEVARQVLQSTKNRVEIRLLDCQVKSVNVREMLAMMQYGNEIDCSWVIKITEPVTVSMNS